MKRPRKFLYFILILLIINTVFFVAWYALDLQGVVKGIVEREAGQALKGRFEIRSFSISDQQVFAEGITFTATDGSLRFNIESARVRFNLLKFLFSAFKMRNLLNHVEVNKAEITYSYVYKPRTKAPPKKFEIPNLKTFFNDLKVSDSSFKLYLNTPVSIGGIGMLTASEQFNDINLNIVNTRVSTVDFRAVSSNRGKLELNAVLDKGRLATSHLEITNYSPQYLNHPNLQNLSTELNLVLDASQKVKNSPLDIDANVILWNTQTLLLTKYPVRIPLLTVKSNGDKLVAEIAQSTVGTSSLGGSIALFGLQKELTFEPSQLELLLDLSMIDPSLHGLVDASLAAEGKLSDPTLTLTAASTDLSYLENVVKNVALEATYADKMLTFTLKDAIWQNQKITLAGIFNTENRQLIGTLDTVPVSLAKEALKINASADIELTLYTKLPEVKTQFRHFDLARGDLNLKSIQGHLNLFPSRENETDSYYIDLDFAATGGTKVSLIGDLLDRNLLLDASFQSLDLADIYPLPIFSQLDPIISGNISSFLTGSKAVVSSDLNVDMSAVLGFVSGLDLTGSYDLDTRQGMAVLISSDASLNEQPLAFELISEIAGRNLTLHSFNLNDQLYVSGSVDLQNLADLAFELNLKDMSSALLMSYFPGLKLPDISGINLSSSYNLDGNDILSAEFIVEECNITGLRPLSAAAIFLGHPSQVEIQGGIDNQARRLIDFSGTANLLEGLDIRIRALADKLAAVDVMYSPLAEGSVDCDVGLYLEDILTSDADLSFDAQVVSSHVSIPEVVDLNDILLRITQTREVITVDTLSVHAANLASINGSGALDYNILTNTFYEGTHSLNLSVEGLLFDWVNKNVDYITAASGKTSLNCAITTMDDQFIVKSGEINIREGKLSLKDQPEQIKNINITALFADSRVILQNFTCQMGGGKLTVLNNFDDEDGSHFKIGILDLGTLSLRIDQPGAVVNIPIYTEPRSHSTVVLKGQNSEYATLKGPFDDMHIFAEVWVYNSEAVYPPNTDNLLNLIYSLRGAFSKPNYLPEDPAPLPFTMDLMIRMVDNIKYTTYPIKLYMQPDGYLHLLYDGTHLTAKEGSFVSERGTIDFFGTVFQAESVVVSIIDSQSLFDIKGIFNRRAVDGTVITLNVTTDPDITKPILERLKFALTSDNPDDRTVTNILARLRYNSPSQDLSNTQNGSLLQDEALSLISENLNTSLVSPFIYPLENTIRRLLRLDNFSINAGFIQNLFTEYSTDPNQLAEYTNMNQFMSDVAQFSSSILLNNLSFNMSKYLGRKFFLDYTLTLQEATDLENKTRIVVSHDTSLRWFLPEQFRLAYTFKYEPQNNTMSHEIMLQRSFRFWGF